jgi:transcriptional regulator with PAS, ATPase and Fis domain
VAADAIQKHGGGMSGGPLPARPMPRKACLNAPMKGTIFLDKIVNTSEAVQMKLLCIIQEKKLKHLGGKNAQH